MDNSSTVPFLAIENKPVKRLDWMDLWDKLRNDLKTGNTTWGRNQILELMDRLEREMIRKFERGGEQDASK